MEGDGSVSTVTATADGSMDTTSRPSGASNATGTGNVPIWPASSDKSIVASSEVDSTPSSALINPPRMTSALGWASSYELPGTAPSDWIPTWKVRVPVAS